MTCGHNNFDMQSRVIRLEDCGKFMLEVEVKCTDCGTPFQFKGLWAGLNTDGAATSLDGTELRIAITPLLEPPHGH